MAQNTVRDRRKNTVILRNAFILTQIQQLNACFMWNINF